MARKNLLAGLTSDPLTAVNSESVTSSEVPLLLPRLPQASNLGSAIGAVTRSIEQLKAHSIVDIDPLLVEPSFITDRLDTSDEELCALVDSIRDHGQQVPILVRPHPAKEGRFQIAYGRRRLLAVQEIGRKVKAIVKPLSDEQLVVAQGQENSARRDLSFIEKALFAARLEQAGYAREIIMTALTVDKTALSRLISSAVKIPPDVIESIGPAQSIGRDRWVTLSVRLERSGAISQVRALAKERSFKDLSSDERFNRIFSEVSPKSPPKMQRQTLLKSEDGAKFGHFHEDARAVFVSIEKKNAADFANYLIEALPKLYGAFKRSEMQR
jgi:ParB family transcriptional regulator, chromosome partitioning protein